MKRNNLLLLSVLALVGFSFSSCSLTRIPNSGELDYTNINGTNGDDASKEDASTEDASPKTNIYTITWKNYNDQIINTTYVEEGALPGFGKATPTKPNEGQYKYVFSGWEPEVCQATQNATYTAKYTSEIIEIAVTFLSENGDVITNKDDYHVGDTVEFPEDPTKTDSNFEYIFSHWEDQEHNEFSSTTLDGNKESFILKPVFDKKEYTITWKNYDNEFLATSTVKSGELPTYPLSNKPTKPDDEHNTYTFVGWDPALDKAHSDATYVARYSSEDLPVKVKWLNHDGTSFKEEDYPVGDGSINLPATNPTKTDEYEWVFVKWETDYHKAPSECSLDGTTMQYTFKPVFEKQKYTITWKNYDDTVLDTTQVESGVLPSTTATPKQKPNSGQYKYTLNGWDSEVVYAHSDKTYTAHFDESVINITVNFYKEDGTTLISTKTDYHVGATISVPDAPTKEKVGDVEYEFDHWEGLNGETLPTGTLDNSKELYNFKAVYKAKAFEIKFIDYNGDSISTISEGVSNTKVGDYTSSIPTASEMASRAEARKNDRYTYTFVGWAIGNSSENDPVEDPITHLIPKDDREDESENYNDLSSITIDRNLTLHAVYELTLRSYDVNFYGKDKDELLGTLTPNYGDDVTFVGHDFSEPVEFSIEAEDETGSTKYTWNNGFQYKDGDNWVSGFTKVKKDLDYYATYDETWTPISESALYFTGEKDFTVALKKSNKSAPNVNIEYSTNGISWESYTTSTTSAKISQKANKKVYFRGTGNTAFASSASYVHQFVLSTGMKLYCNGNIEYLLDYKTVDKGEHPSMGKLCYAFLFNGCSALNSAPELPATTLSDACYYLMFGSCECLKETPELPATNLTTNCYYEMFLSCYSLTTVSLLSVTSLGAASCYEMFKNCTSLKVGEGNKTNVFFTCPSFTANNPVTNMFTNTDGSFTGTPTAGKSYYWY